MEKATEKHTLGGDGSRRSLWCTFFLIPSINIIGIGQYPYPVVFSSDTGERKNPRSEEMEACFLTSNSFTRTIELVPSIQARSLPNTRRKPNQFQCRKAPFPSSIKCCHQRSQDADNDKPSISVDWRSFRARLVAGEQASRLGLEEPSSVVVDNDSAVDVDVDHPPPPIAIGDKWVHTILEPEKGCLLIATEKLDGVHIFERTVILVLSTSPVGPTGVILNRPSLMSIKETRSTVLDVAGTFSDRPLFFGGPIEEGLFLVNSPKGEGEDDGAVQQSGLFEEVMMGLYYGTKESVGCAAEMVRRNAIAVEDFRFFDGYCGWEKEQLRDEIRAGYWTVAACSPSVIGLTSVPRMGLWEEILGLMGPRKVW